jgi:methyl-accepting chemotaxis protein
VGYLEDAAACLVTAADKMREAAAMCSNINQAASEAAGYVQQCGQEDRIRVFTSRLLDLSEKNSEEAAMCQQMADELTTAAQQLAQGW